MKGIENFLVEFRTLLDDKDFYAGFTVAKTLSRAHHTRDCHQPIGLFFERFFD